MIDFLMVFIPVFLLIYISVNIGIVMGIYSESLSCDTIKNSEYFKKLDKIFDRVIAPFNISTDKRWKRAVFPLVKIVEWIPRSITVIVVPVPLRLSMSVRRYITFVKGEDNESSLF